MWQIAKSEQNAHGDVEIKSQGKIRGNYISHLVAALAIVGLLSACETTGSIEGNSQNAQLNETTDGADVSGDLTNANADGTQLAALPSGDAVAFLPVSNAPQTAVTHLASAIRSEADRTGMPVVTSVEDGANYQVKGYFSALEDGSGTLLVYVWDVLDKNNNRVYRINGQESASAKSADPWNSVSPQILDRVAQSTVSQLKSWLATQ